MIVRLIAVTFCLYISAQVFAQIRVEDDTGFISKTICDVILGGDLMWLSRLIALSRRYVSATDVNSSIILVTSVATSLATLFAGLTPLQAIVLFRFAPIAAEINTLLSLNPNASRVAS